MYSAAIQRYFNEHIHLPYSFFLQPQRFIRHALKKKGAFMATAYNYVEPSEADNEDIIEYLATDFDVMAGNTAGRLCVLMKLPEPTMPLHCNTNMTRRLQSRKAELYEQYRAGRISREKFADIQKTDSEKLARLSSRAEEIKRLLVEHYESRGNLAAGKRTADQIILLKDYDPEIIRNFVERVRVYPSGEIEIDMRTSSGFEFVTAS